MSNLAPDRLAAQATGPAARSAYSGLLTTEQEAAAVAELTQAAGWATLLAENAGLVLGYGEHQVYAARPRLDILGPVDGGVLNPALVIDRRRLGVSFMAGRAASVWPALSGGVAIGTAGW